MIDTEKESIQVSFIYYLKQIWVFWLSLLVFLIIAASLHIKYFGLGAQAKLNITYIIAFGPVISWFWEQYKFYKQYRESEQQYRLLLKAFKTHNKLTRTGQEKLDKANQLTTDANTILGQTRNAQEMLAKAYNIKHTINTALTQVEYLQIIDLFQKNMNTIISQYQAMYGPEPPNQRVVIDAELYYKFASLVITYGSVFNICIPESTDSPTMLEKMLYIFSNCMVIKGYGTPNKGITLYSTYSSIKYYATVAMVLSIHSKLVLFGDNLYFHEQLRINLNILNILYNEIVATVETT